MHIHENVTSGYQIQLSAEKENLLTFGSGKLPVFWHFRVALCYRDLYIFWTQSNVS
jgi:hypothetical protein